MSAISTTVTENDRHLLHIVWLPSVAFQKQCALLSTELNWRSFTQSSYELTPGQPRAGRPSFTASFREAGTLLTGRLSLPHVTLAHFWGNPNDGCEIYDQLRTELTLANMDLREPIAANIRGVEIFSRAPRWRGKTGEYDYVACLNVGPDGPLAIANKRLSELLKAADLKSLTGSGEKWFPHFTLAAEPTDFAEHRNLFIGKDSGPVPGAEGGEIVIGFSGPNGQFRGPVWSMSEERQPSRPELARALRTAEASAKA